jgi:hypothetical protein
MKHRIALGTTLLLTLGTAVAGTFLYGQDASGRQVEHSVPLLSATASALQEVTPEMSSAWKATALSTDYMPPKVPI